VQTGDFDAEVFVGGGGSKIHFANKEVLRITKEMYKWETVIAAICLAPVILANAGIFVQKIGCLLRPICDKLTRMANHLVLAHSLHIKTSHTYYYV
jgi:putative intracellular protease/amidase